MKPARSLAKLRSTAVRSTVPAAPSAASPVDRDQKVVNRYIHLRLERYDGNYYYALALKIWRTAIVTLPLDLLFQLVHLPQNIDPRFLASLDQPCLIFACVGVIFTAKKSVLRFTSKLSALRQKFSDTVSKYYAFFIALVCIGAILDIAVNHFESSVITLIGAALIGLSIVASLRDSAGYKKQQDVLFSHDRILWLEHLNLQNFYLTIVPVIGARLISLFGALRSSHFEEGLGGQAPYLFASAVLLLGLFPSREQFIGNCPTCASWISRTLSGTGSCPHCARAQFQLRESARIAPTVTRAEAQMRKIRGAARGLLQRAKEKALKSVER